MIIPCKNEGESISKVILDLKEHLPGARVIVVDNNSSDNTAEIARNLEIEVQDEKMPGKGYAFRSALKICNTPIVLMLDGDFTYPAKFAPKLINAIRQGADMAVGSRVSNSIESYRKGHRVGNFLISMFQRKFANVVVNDTLSGFRAFNINFFNTFVIESKGFELETDLNIHAAAISAKVINIEIEYLPRIENSVSKLNTYSDGLKILKQTLRLLHKFRPLIIYSSISIFTFGVSIILNSIPLLEYFQSGRVNRFPTLIVGTSMLAISIIVIILGIIINEIASLRRDTLIISDKILKMHKKY